MEHMQCDCNLRTGVLTTHRYLEPDTVRFKQERMATRSYYTATNRPSGSSP